MGQGVVMQQGDIDKAEAVVQGLAPEFIGLMQGRLAGPEEMTFQGRRVVRRHALQPLDHGRSVPR